MASHTRFLTVPIWVVFYNLSTLGWRALPGFTHVRCARWVLRRLKFRYVPKHAGWLNMVEIEIGVPRSQCLDRRTATPRQLVSKIATRERQRKNTGVRTNSVFETEKARAKMDRAYLTPVAFPFPRSNERIITSVQWY